MKTIVIIGAGMMGSALAFPARENGNTVRLVGTHLDGEIIAFCKKNGRHPKFRQDFPQGVEFATVDGLRDALDGADFVICGVSSFGVEWFRDAILPLLPDGLPVLSVTKGLQDTPDGRLLTYPEIWRERLDALRKTNPLCAIGGPCTSYELTAHDHSWVTFCGKDRAALERMREALGTDYYHISLSDDVTGIESAVALKNGYALGVALTVGLCRRFFGNEELHYNSQAAVFTQAVREMQRLLEIQGACTLENLSVGIGDLYVTVYGGRTRLVGVLLGEGLSIGEAKEKLQGVTLESLVVAERVARAVRLRAGRGELDPADFPLLLHIDDILTKNKPARIPWDEFTDIG
ncbi:MAG: glycerol-3-phosphate dehydrogenase [Clostridia bacterium]|nr:glycerol-3-phosphate dehydrogenase [Clostridia bacterium]